MNLLSADVASSHYLLAPFNRSDVDKECSWFRMASPSVEGLKQVACEPRTRISRTEPPPAQHDYLVGLRATGGYCDGQLFLFNERLNTLIGPNHAAKSAILDFVRSATGVEDSVDARSPAEVTHARLLQAGLAVLDAEGYHGTRVAIRTPPAIARVYMRAAPGDQRTHAEGSLLE